MFLSGTNTHQNDAKPSVLHEFSQNKHTRAASTQIKDQEIASSPDALSSSLPVVALMDNCCPDL